MSLHDLTREELIQEVVRRTQVAENIWHAVTKVYGPQGFIKVLEEVQRKDMLKAQLKKPAVSPQQTEMPV